MRFPTGWYHGPSTASPLPSFQPLLILKSFEAVLLVFLKEEELQTFIGCGNLGRLCNKSSDEESISKLFRPYKAQSGSLNNPKQHLGM